MNSLMRIRQLFFFLMLLLLSFLVSAAWAQQKTAHEQLDSFLKNVNSATGNFQQQPLGQGSQSAVVQSGDFAFERPGKFRWNVQRPYVQLIVSDGKRLYQYDPDLEQVTERSAQQAVGASPAALLFGSGSLSDSFTLEERPADDSLQWLRAVPKSSDAGFSYVDIGFDKGLPVQLNLLDAFGQITRIMLTDLRTNQPIDAQKFHFEVPAGVDLVKMD